MTAPEQGGECPNDCGEHCGNPAWTREDHDARTDRLRPLAEHFRTGMDDLDRGPYRDTWLQIALLAEDWFTRTDPQPTPPEEQSHG